MRLALFTLCGLLLVCAVGSGQAGKKGAKDDDGKKKKEPEIVEFNGKTIEQWTHEFKSRDPSKRENAMRMVTSFPVNQSKTAVKTLLDELKKHNMPRPIDLSVRISGCLALGMILSSIKDKDEDKADLEHVDDAVKLLKGFCKDSQVIVRTRAVQALGRLARRYPDRVISTINDVAHVADDLDTWEARNAGLETLALLALIKGYKEKAPLPGAIWLTFQRRLDDNSMQVRLTALKSLAQFSQPPVTLDKVSLSELGLLKHIENIARKDEEPIIRIWANLTVMTLQHKVDTEHVKSIAAMVTDEDVALRIQATQALGMIGAQLQALKRAKDKDKPKIEAKVSLGLEQFIFRSLVPTLKDDKVDVVIVGMNALAQSDPALAVGPVLDVLKRKEKGLKAEVAKVLAGIGKTAEAGGPGSGELRRRVFEALQQSALADSDPDVVVVGMTALAYADRLAAVGPLIEILLTRKEPLLRAEAAKVLASISARLRSDKMPSRTAAEKPLIDTLNDRESLVVLNCINALVQMDSVAALPVLQQLSVNPMQQEVVKDAAKQAVKLIQDNSNPNKKAPNGKARIAPR